jgi:branched-chain amino acid transport system ATP-binding protein
MKTILETRSLCRNFDALEVTREVNFALPPGARHALIGPNGAGKTTFINLLTGTLAPHSGEILLDGTAITRLNPAARVKRGLARTFQISQLFKGLTALENVALAVAERRGVAWDLLRRASYHREVTDEALEVLESLHLIDEAHRVVCELPYGRQRLVEIAIALGLKPRVLLLDEPAAGIPSHESAVILDVIATLPIDIAVLIIEHDMDIVFRFANCITVLVNGAILVQGPPAQIAADRQVREIYLGESVHG